MTLGSIVEAFIGSLFGAKQPATKDERKLYRILTVCVVLFLTMLVAFSLKDDDTTAQRHCSINSPPDETTAECVERFEKYAARFTEIGNVDKTSFATCSAKYKDDLESVWDCVRLKDGRSLTDVYRKPGEGD
ncbi:hypothetical protein HED63_26230 [Ochrobactrum cytisi]|nr:hypothetical protein [Brucella cytisi]